MTTPPFTVSARAVNLIAEISARLERHNIAIESEQQLMLRKANRIKTIHSSLAIEGNTLSEGEVSAILNGKSIVAPLRQIQEVKNAIRVYDTYSTLNPFSERDLLKAHGMMMEALADDAGRYRAGGVGVFGENGLVVHMAPPAHRVPQLMGELFEWLRKSKDHLLIRSCVFHYEFEFIHPFSDGNGRCGRLWQSLILGRLNPLFEHLPVENMVYSGQQEYYNAISESTKEADSGPFIDYMLGEILRALKSSESAGTDEKAPNKVPNKVPNKSEIEIIGLLRSNPWLTRKELAEKTGLSDSGVKKILAVLKSNAWIERYGSRKSGKWIVKFGKD